VLEAIAAVSPTIQMPLIAFTYYNPVQRHGLERFAREAVAAGFTACLMTDLPPDEADEWLRHARQHGLQPIFLLTADQHDRANTAGSRARARLYLLRLAHGRHGRARPVARRPARTD
jgi:tryptophan synthase alpha chain